MRKILNEFINGSIQKLNNAQLSLNGSNVKNINIGVEYFDIKFLKEEDINTLNKNFNIGY